MRIFQAVGGLFLVIGVLVVIVVALPLLGLFGGGGFGGVGGIGGFAMLTALPGIVFALVPIGIVFLVVANLMKAAAGPSIDAMPGAVPATATVRAVRRTSMRVNAQPVLRIDLDLAVAGRPPTPVSVRRLIPPEHLDRVRVGVELPAMVDPVDPRRFAIDWARVGLPDDGGVDAALGALADAGVMTSPAEAPASQLLGNAAGYGTGATAMAGAVPGATSTGGATVDVTGATLSALRATGTPARGIVREATDLGIAIGDGRLVRLRLDIVTGDRPGFTTEQVVFVPASSAWRMVTGVTLPLYLDRSEPGRIAIDWEA
ncbi:MAG: hypothetical protein U0869_16620 [Chloroflexota bacterium]